MPVFLSIDVDVLQQAVPLPNLFKKLEIVVADQWLRGLSTPQLTLHYPWLGPPNRLHKQNHEHGVRVVFAGNRSISARGSISKWYLSYPLSKHRIVQMGHARADVGVPTETNPHRFSAEGAKWRHCVGFNLLGGSSWCEHSSKVVGGTYPG